MRKSSRINGKRFGFTVVQGAIRTLKFNIETEVHIECSPNPHEVLAFASMQIKWQVVS